MENQNNKKGDHNTCTSSPLSELLGFDGENLSSDVLDIIYERNSGTPISSDPATARIQREQTIVKHKKGIWDFDC